MTTLSDIIQQEIKKRKEKTFILIRENKIKIRSIYMHNNYLMIRLRKANKLWKIKTTNSFLMVLKIFVNFRLTSQNFNKIKTTSQHKDKSISTQDTSSRKTGYGTGVHSSTKKGSEFYEPEKVNLFSVLLSKLK